MDVGRGQRVLETLELLVDVDARGLAGLDTVALRRLSARSVDVQSWLAAFDTTIARAAAALTVAGTPVDPEPVVSGNGRRSRREAAATVDRATACDAVPEIGAALAAGDLAPAHVDAVAAVTRNMSDAAKERFAGHAAELVDNGRFETPEEFARRCKHLAGQVIDETERLERHERCRRQRKVTRWADPDGMCHTKLSLDPLANARVWAAIEAAFGIVRAGDQSGDDRSFDQLRADTVVELLTGAGPFTADNVTAGGVADGGKTAGRIAADRNAAVGWVGAEVSVLIDLDSLLGRAGVAVCETGDGQPLPVATVRRLCCEARILPVVLNGAGVPTDVGRSQRLATRAQRRALRTMYATCAHPQCTVGFERCRIHHVIFWDRFGPTDLANLIPVCERHHHLVHEGGWTLTLTLDRVATWTAPDGRIVHHGDSRNRGTTAGPAASSTTTAWRAAAGATAGAVSIVERREAPPVNARGVDRASDNQARRMADEVARRRQATAAAAVATTTAATRRTEISAPVPLFATDDTVQRRGPPHAS